VPDTLSLNGLRAVSVRLFTPWTGTWTAEVDFDLAAVPVMPQGSAVLVIGTETLVGAIDPDGSGRFGEKAKARVIGGGGGWHRAVSARQFHNDAGVLTSTVVTATAAEVGERAVVALPQRLGVDFERTAGPASRVLAGLDWYVDATGVTIVGPRATLPVLPDVDILSWDGYEQRADLAADRLITPGTILVDAAGRFETATVRDVEQVFTAGSARAVAWCSGNKSSRLSTLLGSLVREHARVDTLKAYRYRVVTQGPDGRLTLQAVSRTAGVPDSIALPAWYGIPGVDTKVVPGTEALVVFMNGDPSQPAVVSFKGKVQQITIGEGLSPVALATLVTAQLDALKAAITAAPVVAAPDGGLSFKTSLIAALASWPSPVASTKLLSD
jgi:hypothetical protein